MRERASERERGDGEVESWSYKVGEAIRISGHELILSARSLARWHIFLLCVLFCSVCVIVFVGDDFSALLFTVRPVAIFLCGIL